MISLAENCDESGRTDVVYTRDFLGSGGMVQYAPGIAYNPRVFLPYIYPGSPCRPKPDEATIEPSVLQEHANLIAKLEGAEDDGWWGDFGYAPASDRNGIANEAMRQAMTQKPAAPEPPKPKCSCPCHEPGSSVMHFRPCCSSDQPKPQAPDGVFEVAPMGRNPRGWGI